MQQQDRPTNWGMIVAVAAIVLTLGIVAYMNRHPSNETPGEPDLGTWQIPGDFQPVLPTLFDPAAQLVAEWIVVYDGWLKDHPADDTTQAIGEFARLHNQYAPQFRKLGIEVPNIITFDHTHDQVMQPLTDYLNSKGWAARFVGPQAQVIGDAGYRAVGQIILGKIQGVKTGSVKRFTGEEVPYTAYLVFDRQTLDLPGWRLGEEGDTFAYTRGREVILFPQSYAHAVYEILNVCELGKRRQLPDDLDPYTLSTWYQWGPGYVTHGLKHSAHQVTTDLVTNTLAHELQHVADHDLWTLKLDPSLQGMGASLLETFIEARGMLRSCTEGPVPVFGLAEIGYRAASADSAQVPMITGHSGGAQLIRALLGNTALDVGDMDEAARRAREQAATALRRTDKIYQVVLDNAVTDPQRIVELYQELGLEIRAHHFVPK